MLGVVCQSALGATVYGKYPAQDSSWRSQPGARIFHKNTPAYVRGSVSICFGIDRLLLTAGARFQHRAPAGGIATRGWLTKICWHMLRAACAFLYRALFTANGREKSKERAVITRHRL